MYLLAFVTEMMIAIFSLNFHYKVIATVVETMSTNNYRLYLCLYQKLVLYCDLLWAKYFALLY